MDNMNVIIRPVITEKSTRQQATRNEYAFQVHRNANKLQIKHAVEQIYSVKVADVRTLNRKGKPRRTRHGETKTAEWKRAVVVLAGESRIDLF